MASKKKRIRDEVGIDPNRIISAAVDAALGEVQSADTKKKKRHPGRVLAAGAAVAAAAAVGQKRMPRMAKVPLRMAAHKLGDALHVDDIAGAVQDRVVGRDREPDGDLDDEDLDAVDDDFDEVDDEAELDDEEIDEPEGDEDLDEGDEDLDEPRDEAEELDDEDEEDDGFDDEGDDGFDDEPEDDGGPRGGDEAEEPDEELEDDPEAESEDLPADEEPDEDEDEEPEADEPVEDDETSEDDEEDEEQVAARGLDLGVAPGTSRGRRGGESPDLFGALRTPRRRGPVMGSESLRVDPATRPPKPERGRSQRDGERRADNSKSMAARS